MVADWAQRLSNSALPWGTLVVNLIGSVTIGALWALLERFVISPNIRVFLLVGLLGGFTTFSTYSLETVTLLRDGEVRLALVNALTHNALGVGLALGGYLLVRALINAAS